MSWKYKRLLDSCKKFYLKIDFSVFFHCIVFANCMTCASSPLWDYMGARVLQGSEDPKEQVVPCFKCVLFPEKVVMLIQMG